MHHVITEAHGIPLAVSLTGGQRNDITQLMPLVQAIPPVGGAGAARGSGRMRSMPTGAVTTTSTAKQVRTKGITPVIAPRGTGHSSGLGVYRW
jgi:hypothetical protein